MEPEYVSRWHRKLKEHKKNQICGMSQEELEQQAIAQAIEHMKKLAHYKEIIFQVKSRTGIRK